MIGYFFAIIPLYIFVYLPIAGRYSAPRDSVSFLHAFNESFVAPEEPVTCQPHHYTSHILSREPLVVYIPGFLKDDEISHLIKQGEGKFETSLISHGGESKVDESVRLSEVAILDRDDTVKCIEDRARSFQGYREGLAIERLKIQRYGIGGHYSHHYDWRGGGQIDRVSSFMVYVDANCTGGGTQFPRLIRPADKRWCQFIECEDGEEGVTFKPVKGNAIYWENLRADGTGYPETWHAGLPVNSGTKIGLNIWNWG